MVGRVPNIYYPVSSAHQMRNGKSDWAVGLLILNRNQITWWRKVSPAGNCHAYTRTRHSPPGSSLVQSVCPFVHMFLPHTVSLAVHLSGWPRVGGLPKAAAAAMIPHWRLQWGATGERVENVIFLTYCYNYRTEPHMLQDQGLCKARASHNLRMELKQTLHTVSNPTLQWNSESTTIWKMNK